MARKSIGDFFFKVEKTPDEPPKTPVQTATLASVKIGIGQEDAAVRNQLAKALDEANFDGYDYYEFAKTIEAQATLIPAEALRFQATFATASVMGLTFDKLITTAQNYLEVLKKKEDEFLTALQQHTSTAIDLKETDAKKIDADMQAKADQIKQLTEDINALQQQKAAIQNEVSSNRMEIEKVKNNFYATLKVFTDKITNDITKIKTYLSPASGGK